MNLVFKDIEQAIVSLAKTNISEERKTVLQTFSEYIKEKKATGQPINLNFICTHNSRRSHFAQIWAQTLAAYFEIPNVFCYSGGTETTRIYPTVLETFRNIGFQQQQLSGGKNPVFALRFSTTSAPIIAFSKKYNDVFNPQAKFCAVMTCSHANENCPLILGVEKRIPITYEDPKIADGTPQELEKYEECARLIGAELYYAFSRVV